MEKVWSGGVESPKKKEVTIFIFMAADGLNTFHFKAFIEFFTQKCYPTSSTALSVVAKEFLRIRTFDAVFCTDLFANRRQCCP